MFSMFLCGSIFAQLKSDRFRFMKKAVMILFCVISQLTAFAQNGVLEYLYFYNAGVTALEKEKYILADSMFSASINISRTSEAYFNRALVKLKLGSHESFCNDMYMATANGDTNARYIFLGQCTLNDTIYRDSSGKDFLKIVALHKYDAIIDVVTRDNFGNEYWQYPLDTTAFSSADSAEFMKNELMPMFPGGEQG